MYLWIKRNKVIVIILITTFLGLILAVANTNNKTEIIEIEQTPEQIEEQRIKDLIETIEGVSDATVLVTFKNNIEKTKAVGSFYSGNDASKNEYTINGIAISTEGGDSVLLVEKMKSLLCAAYDITSDMVYICGK